MGNRVYRAWGAKREPTDLPVEILVDIFSRADLVSLVRCAATSKLLRRLITAPGFLRQLRKRNNADGRFVPSLLVGIFFRSDDEARRFLPVPPSSKLKLSLAPPSVYFDPFMHHPPESRAGLVVLYRPRRAAVGAVELCVFCPVTRHYNLLPRGALRGYSHVLLSGDGDEDDDQLGSNFCGLRNEGAARSFRLLVLDRAVRTQTFSSRTGAWGPVIKRPTHLDLPHPFEPRGSALVLGGVAHWLYHRNGHHQRYAVLAINVGTGSATAIEVPQRCVRRRRREEAWEMLLVRSVDGRLGLLVAEALAIAMWTLSEDATSWARRLVVDRATMLRPLTLDRHPLGCINTQLEWFGEATGAVVLQLQGAGILLLDLQTGEISQLRKDRNHGWPQPLGCCPYEMDMVSLLAAMKRF